MPKYSPKEGYKHYAKAKGGHGTKKEKGYSYSGSKPKQRKGWSDSPFKYEDGGVVGGIEDAAKINALEMLRDEMASLGSESLLGELKQRFQDGGVVESESNDDESNEDYDDLTREELLDILRSRL